MELPLVNESVPRRGSFSEKWVGLFSGLSFFSLFAGNCVIESWVHNILIRDQALLGNQTLQIYSFSKWYVHKTGADAPDIMSPTYLRFEKLATGSLLIWG